jgi:sulfur carrier protein
MAEKEISVQINGKQEHLSDGMSLKRLLEHKGISPNVVACELNMTIVRRAALAETFLKEGDQLEILHMIGGG